MCKYLSVAICLNSSCPVSPLTSHCLFPSSAKICSGLSNLASPSNFPVPYSSSLVVGAHKLQPSCLIFSVRSKKKRSVGDEGMMDRYNDLCWYGHVHNFVFEPRLAWKSHWRTFIGALWLRNVRRTISVLWFQSSLIFINLQESLAFVWMNFATSRENIGGGV